MQVFQTAGAPPQFGRIILAIMGWMQNSKAALTKSVMANNGRTRTTSTPQQGPRAPGRKNSGVRILLHGYNHLFFLRPLLTRSSRRGPHGKRAIVEPDRKLTAEE